MGNVCGESRTVRWFQLFAVDQGLLGGPEVCGQSGRRSSCQDQVVKLSFVKSQCGWGPVRSYLVVQDHGLVRSCWMAMRVLGFGPLGADYRFRVWVMPVGFPSVRAFPLVSRQ